MLIDETGFEIGTLSPRSSYFKTGQIAVQVEGRNNKNGENYKTQNLSQSFLAAGGGLRCRQQVLRCQNSAPSRYRLRTTPDTLRISRRRPVPKSRASVLIIPKPRMIQAPQSLWMFAPRKPIREVTSRERSTFHSLNLNQDSLNAALQLECAGCENNLLFYDISKTSHEHKSVTG